MMQDSYKVGQKVRVRPDLNTLDDCKAGLTSEMREFAGKIVTIKSIVKEGIYFICEDKGDWNWSDDCFVKNKG